MDTADLRDEVMALSQDRANLKSELLQAKDMLRKVQQSYSTSQVISSFIPSVYHHDNNSEMIIIVPLLILYR